MPSPSALRSRRCRFGRFFKTSRAARVWRRKGPALQAQFKRTNGAVMSAMGAYAAWIKRSNRTELSRSAPTPIKRLLYEDALDMPLDQYLPYGENALEQTRAEFVATAKKINPKATPLQVYLSIMRKSTPKPDALLATASTTSQLRAFVEAKHIITLPADANIKVIETPAFERTTTSAAEDSPGPLETVATQAYYNVTPADPTWHAPKQEQIPGAIQRLRVSDHLGTRSLPRALHQLFDRSRPQPEPNAQALGRAPSLPRAGRTTASR